MLSVYALVHLGEIQRRKAYEDAGYPTMFAYCLGELRYSEGTAYRRLQAAGAASKFPEILAFVKDGALNVCALSMIAKHLTRENCARVIQRIEGKSLRVVERMVAELNPLPDTRDLVRRSPLSPIPAPGPATDTREPAATEIKGPPPEENETSAAKPLSRGQPLLPEDGSPAVRDKPVFAPQVIMPRSPNRVYFAFTGSEELRRVIDRCTELLWHKHPSGRIEDVLLEVGRAYLKMKDPELQLPSKPKPPRALDKRRIPRWVRSAVYRRDAGRCAHLGGEGRRCDATAGLEYDHIQPWAKGGRSDDPANIRLLCRAHNRQAAREAGLL